MGDVLDEALGVFADTGPEYDAFDGLISFANHGPMVVEALCAMGREDAVMAWAERYRPRLAPRPRSRARIDPSEWADALGDITDEHGIKVTEVCLRAHKFDPHPVYLAASLSTTRRLNEVGLNLY